MFSSLLEKRRSIRKFQDKEIEAEKLDMLIEAALRAPSSMGRNPWEFIVVRDQDTLAKLSAAKPHGASFLRHAPLGIVVCADPEKSDVWVEDASIATIFILLAAESIGLGGCWIQFRKRMYDKEKSAKAYICELLNIPDKMEILSIVALGYPDEQKPPHRKKDLLYENVYFEKYGR